VTRVPRELWPIVYRFATSGDWPPRSDADVDAFFGFAKLERLLPLLMADPDVPAEVAAAKSRFRALDALYEKRYQLSRDAALELQRIIGAHAFLFLKGSDYRYRLYARPRLRPMADIDIYVPARDFRAVLSRLAAAGNPRKYSDHGAAFAPGHHEVSIEIDGVHVEPHRSFAQRVRARIDYEGLWQRREWFEHDGIRGYRLSPADAILCHAFYFAMDEFSSPLIRYLDFYLLLQQYEHELSDCAVRAKPWGIERPLFGALHVTTELFPSARTKAVEDAMHLLLDAPTRRFLVDRVLPDPATEPSGHVTGRRVQLWRKYSLMDQRWRSILLLAYHLYEVAIGSLIEWQTRRKGHLIPPRPTTRPR